MADEFSKSQRRGATLLYDTGEREDDALSRLQWIVPTVFLGTVLILFFAVVEWFSPTLPVLLFVGLIWVPASLFMVWRTESTDLRKLAGAVVLVGAFGLPLLAWGAGPYRAAVLFATGDLLPMDAAMKAADDDSDRVATRACARVLSSDESGRIERMSAVLQTRPVVAHRCLSDLDEEHRGARLRIAKHLHESWYYGWMTAEDFDVDVGCKGAEFFSDIALMHGGDSVPDLLMCSLEAQNQEFSACCGAALSKFESDEEILDVRPWAWSREIDEPLFLALIEAVDVPAVTLMSAEPLNDSLRWTPADLFHWTTHLGCHLVGTSDRSESVARLLSQTIDTQCGLDVGDPLFSFTAVQFVERACDTAVLTSEVERVDVVEWCDASRVANRETAVDSARFIVERTLAAYGVEELERSIARGGRLVEIARSDQPFVTVESLSDTRSDLDVGTDGVRRGRPGWADHTPEARERLGDMRREQDRRRQEVRSTTERDHDMSDEEYERRVNQTAREQRREELRQMVR